ncbi:MAG: serine/threonine-protein kinase [Myxococcaceae bacterium]
MTALGEQHFGRYVLLEPLGAGGMAEVWRARLDAEHGFSRDVVIKRIRRALATDGEFAKLFAREARLTARLHHANIVQVFEYGEFEGEPYLAMEYVAGLDLHRLERAVNGRLPFGIAAYIARELGRALACAHDARDEQGELVHLVHRDVSPSNVMLGADGSVKLFDFGIARTAHEAPLTDHGGFRGKLGYTAPEVVEGLPHDARSDLFGLGVVLYEMITGKRLFVGENDAATLKLVHAANVPLLSSVVPDVPPALENVVHKLLARLSGDRFETAQAFVDAIDPVVHELSTGPSQLAELIARHRANAPVTIARPPAPVPRDAVATPASAPPPPGPSRRAVVVVTLVVGVLAAGVAAFVLSHFGGAADQPAPPVPVPQVVVVPTPLPPTTPSPADAGAPVAIVTPAPKPLRVTSTPSGASVLAAGVKLGQTPLKLEWKAGEKRPEQLQLELKGFASVSVAVTAEQPTLAVTLKRSRGKTTRTKNTTPDIKGGQVVDPFK